MIHLGDRIRTIRINKAIEITRKRRQELEIELKEAEDREERRDSYPLENLIKRNKYLKEYKKCQEDIQEIIEYSKEAIENAELIKNNFEETLK